MGTTTDTASGDSMTGDQRVPMPSHTPGPWHVDGFNMAAVIARGQNTGEWELIVNVHTPNWKADTRLIAAAPTMLDALHEIEWLFDGEEDIDHNGGPNTAMKALAVVREAIRKAEGK